MADVIYAHCIRSSNSLPKVMQSQDLVSSVLAVLPRLWVQGRASIYGCGGYSLCRGQLETNLRFAC